MEFVVEHSGDRGRLFLCARIEGEERFLALLGMTELIPVVRAKFSSSNTFVDRLYG